MMTIGFEAFYMQVHAKLDPLVEIGRAATSQNTNRAYAADWREYLRWRARQGPECIRFYLAAMASGAAGGRARTVASIERRSIGARVEFRPECPALRPQVTTGVRGNLSERDREEKFSGHSSRAGLASSAEIDERYLQKDLGHALAEMTHRYQRRRDRHFRRRFRPAAWRANSLATQACVPKTPETSAGTSRSTSGLGRCRLSPNPSNNRPGPSAPNSSRWSRPPGLRPRRLLARLSARARSSGPRSAAALRPRMRRLLLAMMASGTADGTAGRGPSEPLNGSLRSNDRHVARAFAGVRRSHDQPHWPARSCGRRCCTERRRS